MSHNVESMAFLGKVPWHGLGEEVEEINAYDFKYCIDVSGLNWRVENKQCFINLEDGWKPVPAYATVRTSDNKVLGVVGEQYEILQNIDAFEIFQPLLNSKLFRINTCGSLDEGRRIWILAEVVGDPLFIRDNDLIRKFVLLSHGHDGKSMVRFGLTPIRVVCSNTLAMAHKDNLSNLFKIKHTQNMVQKLINVRDIIKEVNQSYELTAQKYSILAHKSCNNEQLEQYIKAVLDVDEEKISTRTFNIIERIKSYFIHSPGARGESWFDAYNALTYYLSHDYGNTANNRLSSLWFGKNFELNKKALELALNE